MALVDNGLRITRAFFTETGTTPDMVARNFTTAVSPQSIRALDELTQGGTISTAGSLAGVAGDILVVDMNNARTLDLPNTLATKRLRFILELCNPTTQLTANTRIFITGYTDFAGIAPAHSAFAPDMRLYFNNAIEVRHSQRRGPDGNVIPMTSTVHCDHILHPNTLGMPAQNLTPQFSFNPNGGIERGNMPTYIRPVDIMVKSRELSSQDGDLDIDTRTAIQTGMSNRGNNIPALYLEKTMAGFQKANFDLANRPAYGSDNLYSYAAANTLEATPSQNRFLTKLINNYDYLTNGYVTWDTLVRAYPEVDTPQVTKYVGLREMHRQKSDLYIPNRGDFDSLNNNATIHSQIISQVLQSVPALLLERLIIECTLHVTNMSQSGISVTMTAPITLVDLGSQYMRTMVPMVCSQLEQIVFNNMSSHRFADFTLDLRINTLGETMARIMYNGTTFETAVPSYCDAMNSLIVSPNGSTISDMAGDFDYINGSIFNQAGVLSDNQSPITPTWQNQNTQQPPAQQQMWQNTATQWDNGQQPQQNTGFF